MNQKQLPWIILGIILVIGGGLYLFNRSNQSKIESEKTKMAAEALMKQEETDKMSKEDAMKKEDSISDKDSMSKEDAMKKTGSYKEYSPQTVASEQAAGNKVVLFFYAPWCPYCRAADKAFTENLDKIPAGVTLLKTDYDSNKDLKKKYGVTTQHTFVQIDDKGERITLWVSGDVELLKQNVK